MIKISLTRKINVAFVKNAIFLKNKYSQSNKRIKCCFYIYLQNKRNVNFSHYA